MAKANKKLLVVENRDDDEAEEIFGAEPKKQPSPFKRLVDAFTAINDRWEESINAAWDHKKRVFGDAANEALSFFGGEHSFLFDPNDDRCMFKKDKLKAMEAEVPTFQFTYNIVAELVQIFGPAIYHRNPNRQCVPLMPLELRMEYYVNPVLELMAAKAENELNSAIQQIAGPLAQEFIKAGAEQDVAMQQAQQMAMQDPRLQPLGMKFMELDAKVQQGRERYEYHMAMQKGLLAKSYTEAAIQEKLLNYGPEITDLRTDCRKVVDETLIKGHGIWLTELAKHPAGNQYVAASKFVSIDRYLIDPDVDDEKDAKWIAIQYVEPVWQLEDEWGYERGTLKGNACSGLSGSNYSGKESAWLPYDMVNAAAHRDVKQTNDLMVYWKVFSKMGIGERLSGVKEPALMNTLESFGDYCCLLICDTMSHPINLHPDDIRNKDADELRQDLQWPTPFHKIGEWPTTSLTFHWMPGCAYGMSHVTPGIGELKFLDYAMSHLANKVRTASQDLVGVMKAAADELTKSFNTITKNGYTFVEVEGMWGKSVSECIQFLQKPPFQADVWTVISMVAGRLDKRLGLTEIAYGLSSTQSRSALDSKNKQDNFSIRPDDMASTVEEGAKKISKKEAYAICYHYDREDVKWALGEAGAEIYMELIASRPPEDVIRQYTYTIEAGSIRRPNKDRDIENMNLLTQTGLPIISGYGLNTGDMEPLNWFFRQVARVYTIDITGLNFQSFTPGQAPNPTPEQLQAMQIQQQISEINLQTALQTAKNNLEKIKSIEAQINANLQKVESELAKGVAKLREQAEQHIQKLQQMEEKHDQEMRQDEEQHDQEMRQDEEAVDTMGYNKPDGVRSYR